MLLLSRFAGSHVHVLINSNAWCKISKKVSVGAALLYVEQLYPTQMAYWSKNYVTILTRAAIEAEPYKPHSIPPNWGRPTLSQGAQNAVSSPLSPPEKASIPKLKCEALETVKLGGPLTESAYALQLLWPLWKQSIYTLQLLLRAL